MAIRLLSRVKGTLRLRFIDRPYRTGDLLDLQVDLKSRSRLGPGRVTVSALCFEVVQKWHTDGDGTRRMITDKQLLLSDELVSRENYSIGPGESASLRFMSQVPEPWHPGSRGDDTPAHLEQMRQVRAAVTSYDRTVHWMLESRLDVRGLDLVDRRAIDVKVRGRG